MTILERTKADGTKVLAVYMTLRNRSSGAQERYRRDCKLQTRHGALREERDVLKFWERHGTVMPLLDAKAERRKAGTSDVEVATVANVERTWDAAVERLREVAFPKLKPSTRVGYDELLDSGAFRRWEGIHLDKIQRPEIDVWDARIVGTVSDSRRRNFHVVMRSTFNAAKDAGWIGRLPDFPALPKVGRKEVEATHPEDVEALLLEKDDDPKSYVARTRQSARLAFALGAYAGLRASEVRALRDRDEDLRAGTITVRQAAVHGEIDTPKSGHERVIPIAPALLPILKRAWRDGRKPDDLVACKVNGEPWGDSGLIQALRRACKRLGLDKSRYHSLRHYFATSLFAGGTDAKTAQALLGHASLAVTDRYAHADSGRKRSAVNVFRAPRGKPAKFGRAKAA